MNTQSAGNERSTGSSSSTVRAYCLELLESGSLAAKLQPPRIASGEFVQDSDPGSPLFIDAPVRAAEIAFGRGNPVVVSSHALRGRDKNRRAPLPPLHELADPRSSSACLARFAHHELMAVELFAWALLAYPNLPAPLRHGFLRVLEEEQLHLRLYLDRLAELGSSLEEHPVGDYFWRQVPAIRQSPAGALAFLSAMGLTFEQANLDYAQLYRDAYTRIGDLRTAAIVDRVHQDEIGHVRLAVVWLRRLGASRTSEDVGQIDRDVAIYEATVPFPLSAARAKGRNFDVESRRRAGMTDEFIEYVRNARPYRDSHKTGGSG